MRSIQLLVLALLATAARADSIPTIPITSQQVKKITVGSEGSESLISESFSPGFDTLGIVDVPAFNSKLGKLDAAFIDWSATINGREHYQTWPPYDFRPLTATYTQTATASILIDSAEPQGFSETETLSLTETVFAQICQPCTVGSTFHLSGEAQIIDTAFFVSTGSNQFVPILASSSEDGNAMTGNPSIIFPDAFLSGSGAGFNISMTYEFTPVPEPATIAVLGTALMILAGFGKRLSASNRNSLQVPRYKVGRVLKRYWTGRSRAALEL